LTVLSKIQAAELITQDDAVEQLKEFIRLNMFIDSYDKIGELYQKGQRDEAIELLKVSYEQLESFSIKKSVGYIQVYTFILDRIKERSENNFDKANLRVSRK